MWKAPEQWSTQQRAGLLKSAEYYRSAMRGTHGMWRRMRAWLPWNYSWRVSTLGWTIG